MELVEGHSLDQHIVPGGLPVSRVLDLGLALAEALAAAHDKGVVHRDLKPANVMLTRDGHVKVLDFGLAKLQDTSGLGVTQAATVAPLSSAGQVLGTVPYMSPEQVKGQAVDARTDIFSLGVVLYELATGNRPFVGANSAETISAILRDTPRPVTEIRRDAPRHLARIIEHCLEKDPESRFQTAKDVRNELRALVTELVSGRVEANSVTTASPPSTIPSSPGGFRRGLWMVGGAAIMTAVVVAIWFAGRGQNNRGATSKPQTSAVATEINSLAVLPKALEARDPALAQLKADNYMRSLHTDPRWNALLKADEISRNNLLSRKVYGTTMATHEITTEFGRGKGDRARTQARLSRADRPSPAVVG